MSAPRTPIGKGRAWIALHTRKLNDAELKMCSNAARLLFDELMLLSADQGLEGRIPSDPRHLQVTIQLEGGVPEMTSALKELVDTAKVIEDPNGDAKYLYIRAWGWNQADRGGVETRPAASAVSQPVRRHREGYHHSEPRPNCLLCQHELGSHQATALVDCPRCEELTGPESADGPGASTTTATPARVASEASRDGERTMRAVLADFTAAIPQDLANFDSPFEGYTALLQGADDVAAAVADLSDDARGALRNVVLAHALRNLLDEHISQSGVTRATKAAKALGDSGHRYWVQAAVLAAGHHFEDENHCLNWMTKTARSERSKAAA